VPPLAQATLVSARTLPAVGIGPDQCRELPERGQSRCSWRADHDVWGHALLAASIGAYPRAKVRLECAFPSDGSDRGEDSCSVSRAD
jgi:hypothetical protein